MQIQYLVNVGMDMELGVKISEPDINYNVVYPKKVILTKKVL